MAFRIGLGVDYHQLREGRDFWLGGVLIPFEKGALGHSDADVLLHAISDALLGAAALGDIGQHFPDNDPAYKDADSRILLERVAALVRARGYRLENVDATVCLQAPKIGPHIPAMRRCIAATLGIDEDAVSVKATTTEQMGFVGRGEGVSAYATALISR